MVICAIYFGLSLGFSPTTMIGTLCLFRFWLGFGINGDYPLSATIMSEYANKKTRGAFIAAVFAMQGVRIIFGSLVSLILASIFLHSSEFKAANSYKLFSNELWQCQGLHLIGTMSTWFLLDITYYSQNLTQKDIVPVMRTMEAPERSGRVERNVPGFTRHVRDCPVQDFPRLLVRRLLPRKKEMFQVSSSMFVIALFETFTGYWFPVFFIEKLRRFNV
ncbi:PREDICTED: inorganic phosphate transporter 1-11-like [Ipomoea nil]|uniref:inorganic phosphate transporter 1-11-like n=1 Tax=Ipomoea nil TaxID=35883 RepID=UPI0009017943|nr:PREDICTED: inorganic phosphate transporter 1-11-like [Ipomoea nil]